MAQVVFVRKRTVEVQYLRATITDEQRQRLRNPGRRCSAAGSSRGCSCRRVASAFRRIRVRPVRSWGSVSISAIWSRPPCCASRESTLVCLTNLLTKHPPMPPKLNRRRALIVLSKIDEILAWEARHENERDTKFVELGKYLCEVRAGQYWRLENLKSFDEFLERRFPESRRKAYYLMSIHEHLPPQVRRELKAGGLDEGAGVGQAGAQAGAALRKCNLVAQSPSRCRRQSSSGKWRRS